MPDIIKYYLSEEPKLNQVETFRCFEKIQREHVIDNIGKMVVKPADGSGGYGIMIGPKAKLHEREVFQKRIMENPRNYIAQPLRSIINYSNSFKEICLNHDIKISDLLYYQEKIHMLLWVD